LVAGQFTYSCELLSGMANDDDDNNNNDDLSAVVTSVLEQQHYASAGEAGGYSFFPDEILSQYPILDVGSFKTSFRESRSSVKQKSHSNSNSVSIRVPALRGARRDTDARAMEFAVENAKQVALERSTTLSSSSSSLGVFVDGTSARELLDMLGLDDAPRRIECFDVSHTAGDFTVASRVVFLDGKPAKHLYRSFNIKKGKIDDYASLEEAVERRFKRAININNNNDEDDEDEAWKLPDLVVIDGGLGQLNAARKGMTNAAATKGTSDTVVSNVPFCALAKNHEEVYVEGKRKPVNSAPDTPGLLLLRSIRDESHRFALMKHKRQRSVVA